jgi:transposase
MEKFRVLDRDQQLLLPYDLRDWIAEDDFVHFVIESVESIDLNSFSFNRRGTGSENYHPHTMLALLIYCYATGTFSSRRIETASYRDIAVRYILCNTHPDHSTIAEFRRKNKEAVANSFLHILKLAHELKLLKVGTISVDGTKIKASASKKNNVSYDRAVELEQQLKLDIAELMEQAEKADTLENADASKLPEEIARRETLKRKISEAKTALELRDQERISRETAEFERKKKERGDQDRKPRGRKPKEPDQSIRGDLCQNLTDGDSRVMKHSKTSELVQGFNVQQAVDADGSMLILGCYVTNNGNDKAELEKIATSVHPEIGTVTTVLADAGYGSEIPIHNLQKRGIIPLVSVHSGGQEEHRHYDFRPRSDGEKSKKKPKKSQKEWVTRMKETMSQPENRELYKKRQETAEPVFGIIKQAMGFRQFLTRGIENVANEWNLVATAYNLRRMFSMEMAKKRG